MNATKGPRAEKTDKFIEKLKNKFKEIENNTNKNSVIHLARVSDDLFSYYLISKNERYNNRRGVGFLQYYL